MTDTAAHRKRRLPAGFWSVWTAVALDLLGFGIIIPLLPLYAEEFEANAFVIGALFASYSLAQFVFSPIWGRVSDRLGRRPVLLVTIAGSAIGSLILGLAGSLVVLFIGRIVDGISGASVAVARATVADIADDGQRPRLMGLLGAAFGLGFVIGPAIGGLATQFGSAVPFFVAAALSAVNFAMAFVRLPETRTRLETHRSAGSLSTLSPVVQRLIVVGFGAVTAFAAFEATFSLLASDRLGATESTVAFVFAAVGLVLVATQGGLIGPLTDRLGETNVIRLGQLLDLAGFLLIAFSAAWLPLAVGLFLLALGQGLLTPALSSGIAAATGPAGAGLALGIQQSAGGLARVVGPLLGGWLYAIAVPAPYIAAAGISLIVLPLIPSVKGATPAPLPSEA